MTTTASDAPTAAPVAPPPSSRPSLSLPPPPLLPRNVNGSLHRDQMRFCHKRSGKDKKSLACWWFYMWLRIMLIYINFNFDFPLTLIFWKLLRQWAHNTRERTYSEYKHPIYELLENKTRIQGWICVWFYDNIIRFLSYLKTLTVLYVLNISRIIHGCAEIRNLFQVLNMISFSTREINFVFPSIHVFYCLLYKGSMFSKTRS